MLIEQLSHGAAVAVTFVDRIILTAVLVQYLGPSKFESWSICIAWAGLVSLFELGLNMHFNNRLMQETERGNHDAAARLYFVSNFLFVVSSIAALATGVALVLVTSRPEPQGSPELFQCALLLAFAAASRIATSGTSSLYRANREYGRLVAIMTAGEALRIFCAAAAAMSGTGLLGIAVAATIPQVAVQVVFLTMDALSRFRPHRLGFVIPRRTELYDILSQSMGYFGQTVPIILLTSVPVLHLQSLALDAGAIAAFVLIRTMSGLPRSLLQAFSISFGQECGRRIAIGDQKGAFAVLAESGRLTSVLSGLAAGLLLAAGAQVMELWTGEPRIYEQSYLLVGILPMLVVASGVLAHNVLIASGAPYIAAAGRWTQFFLTAAVAYLAPIDDAVLRILLALSIGEVLGYTPLAYWALSKHIPGASWDMHARQAALTLAAAILAFATTYATFLTIGAGDRIEILLALVVSSLVCGLFACLLGIRTDRWRRLRASLAGRLASRGE